MGRDFLVDFNKVFYPPKSLLYISSFINYALLSLVFIQLSGLFKGYTLSSGGWLKDDNPSGNYLRVERIKGNSQSKTEKSQPKQDTHHKDFYEEAR
jgi:hypothetical protein